MSDSVYMALRTNDVLSLLSDPGVAPFDGTAYVRRHKIPSGFAAKSIRRAFQPSMENAHSAASRRFAVPQDERSIGAYRPRIREAAARLLAMLPIGESFDFVERVATPLAAEATAALFGFPASEALYVAARTAKLAQAMSPEHPVQNFDAVETAALELHAYVHAYLRHRMTAPRNDGLSRIAKDWTHSRTSPLTELAFHVVGAIVRDWPARSAFAMTVAQLLQRQQDWSALKKDRSLLSGAVSEAMRLEPPVGSLVRVTKRDYRLGEATIPMDSTLLLCILPTMRDADVFSRPDEFDIFRKRALRHRLVFGGDAHHCCAEEAARCVIEEGVSVMLEADLKLAVKRQPRMLGAGPFRQISPMHMRVGASRRRFGASARR